jgi:hypothetical protein
MITSPPACIGPRKGPTILGLMYAVFPAFKKEVVSKT